MTGIILCLSISLNWSIWANTIPWRIYSGVGRIPRDRLKCPKTMSRRDLNICWLFQDLQFQASHSKSFEFSNPNLSLNRLTKSSSLCLSSALGLCLFLFSVLLIFKTVLWPFYSFSTVIWSKWIIPFFNWQVMVLFFYHCCHLDSRTMHDKQSNWFQIPSSVS